MKSSKKGQMSTFVIIGIVILLVSVFTFIAINRNKSNQIVDSTLSVTHSTEVKLLNSYRDNCIKDSVYDAITFNSIFPNEIYEDVLEEDINQRINSCLDLSIFADKGYIVVSYYPDTTVEINDQTINVYGYVKVELDSPDNSERIEIEEFSYSFDKSTFTSLELDSDGKTTKSTQLVSSDNSMVIYVPEDAQFKDYEGNVIDTMEVKVIDKKEMTTTEFSADNDLVLGDKVYFVSYSSINKDVEVCINYNPFLLNGFSEDDLAVAWYDEWRGIWVSEESTINKEEHTVCTYLNHFTVVAPVFENFIFHETIDFYLEHIHRPCNPVPEGGLDPVRPESDDRYVGLFNKDLTSQIEEKHEETRWKLNNFFDGETEDWKRYERTIAHPENSYNGPDGTEPKFSEHLGAVYATPQMFETLLVRGHNTEGGDKAGEYGEYESGDYRARYDEIYDVDSGEIKNPQTIWKTTEWDRVSGQEDVSLDDWKLVPTFEPNEHAELQIDDWDDDDQEKLIDPNCKYYDDKVSCLLCENSEGLTMPCEKFTESTDFIVETSVDLAMACYSKCRTDPESGVVALYEDNFPTWAPWNTGEEGDGILDFKWDGGDLIRNKLTCKFTSDIRSVGANQKEYITAIESCDVDLEDIATPQFWGYYREPLNEDHLGYYGVGNDEHKTEQTLEIPDENVLCPDIEAYMDVDCSAYDICYVQVNDLLYAFCNPHPEFGLDDCPAVGESIEGLDKTIDIAAPCGSEENVGKCRAHVPEGTLHQGENDLVGWVTNRDESYDVCAHLIVEFLNADCNGPPKTGEEYCGDGVWDPDGIDDIPGNEDDEECDYADPVTGFNCGLDCKYPDDYPFCGDGILGNTPGELCDWKDESTGGGACEYNECMLQGQTCECPSVQDGCGDGNIDPGEECDYSDPSTGVGSCDYTACMVNEPRCECSTESKCGDGIDDGEECDWKNNGFGFGECDYNDCMLVGERCSCPAPTDEKICVRCHFDQGVPGCPRTATPNCNAGGHDAHCNDYKVWVPVSELEGLKGQELKDKKWSYCPDFKTECSPCKKTDLCDNVNCDFDNGWFCNPKNGKCYLDLCAEKLCPTGQVCDSLTGKCKGDKCYGISCSLNWECSPANGKCICSNDDACAAGWECVSGQCKKEGTGKPPSTDPCADVTCATGSTCKKGTCEVNKKPPKETPPTKPTDPCASVTCATGSTCKKGTCEVNKKPCTREDWPSDHPTKSGCKSCCP